MFKNFKKKFASKKAFTLIELIIVIAIIGVLVAILVPTMTGFVDDAKVATAKANARTVYSIASAQLTFMTINDETVADGTYTQADTAGFGGKVKDELGEIDGTYAITVLSGAVTQVVFTHPDSTESDPIVGEYPEPAAGGDDGE